MKIRTWIGAAAVVLFASCDNLTSSKYTIDWDLESIAASGMKVDSVNIVVGNKTLQSIKDIKDNRMIAEGEISEPQIASLVLYASIEGEQQSANCDIILEEGEIVIDNEYGCATGTPLNDAVLKLYKSIIEESKKENIELDAIVGMLRNYIVEHKDDVSSAYVLNSSGMFTTLEDSVLTDLYNTLSPEMQKQPMAVEVIDKMKVRAKTAENAMFVDFEAEYNGKVAKLSDYVGKGKYVLVDFWASWCGPCRAEIPNIIKVYKKYKGDNFDVLGVACWDKPEDSEKAIKELGIEYPQILNSQNAASDAYSIEGIPEIILFSPDGKILKRGLRGKEIEEAVKNVL